ncbi:hypothetical protein FRC98_09675 [Lujinxingia vulgaris]|uniref:Uncharacterized protein n=1 Tax=Lujinxingia vulgaris TaxID=2600176 RepID=A0A5C6XCJ6_9DELT|nr:hypothetical protein [Lujinxingia vulgaris]TXD37001.1 hypothetical protein FRC98_09675 [Lujinxingia vulgaris]
MKKRFLSGVCSILLLLGLSACSTSGTPSSDETSAPTEQAQTEGQESESQDATAGQNDAMGQKMGQMCPMQVEGTTREIVRLDNAVAMDFTTTGDVEELRARVEKMPEHHAKMHGEDGQMPRGHGHHGQGGQMRHEQMSEEHQEMRRQMMEMMADVTLATEPIENGMRLTFTPADASQVDALYQMMQSHAQMMEQEGQCPMMPMMGDAQET